jgi:peptidoglycan hydrolase CwlO-like protein
MNWLKKTFLWLKKHWKWVAGSLVVLFSMLAVTAYKDDLKRLLIQKKKISLAKHKRDVAVLTEKRELVRAKIDHTEDQIKEVDDLIEYINEDIEKDRKEILSLALNEKLDKFDDLNY